MTRKFRMPSIPGASPEINLNLQKLQDEINRIWKSTQTQVPTVVATTATEEVEETEEVASPIVIYPDKPSVSMAFSVVAEQFSRFRCTWTEVADANLLQYILYVNTSSTKPTKGDKTKIIKRASKGEKSVIITSGTTTEETGITIGVIASYYFWISTIDTEGNESNLIAASTNPTTLLGTNTIITGENILLTLKGTTNTDYSATLRLAGEVADNWQGGYLQYDALANTFIIGTHNSDDKSTANDIEVIVIGRATGNVSINTTTPAGKLHIASPTGTTALVLDATDNPITDNDPVIELRCDGAAKARMFYDESASVLSLSGAGSSQNHLNVDASGNIGIKTKTPGGAFDIAPGTTGGYFFQKAEATATLSGASTTVQINVPSGSKVLGVQLRVDTLITSGDGATSWAAAYSGGLTQAITTGQAFTKNVKVNTHYDENAASAIAGSEVDITITPNAGTFSGGVIRAIVYYNGFTAMADAA